MNVPVRVLKDRLSHYLRRVQAGTRVVVTDHDRPIAEIVPLAPERLTARQRLDALAAAGDVTVPSGKAFAVVTPSKIRGRPLSRTLLEDRR